MTVPNPYNPYNTHTNSASTKPSTAQSQYNDYYAASSMPAQPQVQNAFDYTMLSSENRLTLPAYGCSIGDAFVRFWKKFLDAKGRASRSEFWWCMLMYWLPLLSLGLLFGLTGVDDKVSNIVELIVKVVLFLPFVTLSVRRLHDSNRDGKVLVTLLVISGFGTLLGRFGGMTLAFGAWDMMSGGSMDSFHTGLGVVIVALLLIVAAPIAYVVFMALPSNPEGARFDEISIERVQKSMSMAGAARPQAADYADTSARPAAFPASHVQSPYAPQSMHVPQNTYAPYAGAVFTPQGMVQTAATQPGNRAAQPSKSPLLDSPEPPELPGSTI